MNAKEFRWAVAGWAFAVPEGIKNRLALVEGKELTEQQKEEVEAMKEKLCGPSSGGSEDRRTAKPL